MRVLVLSGGGSKGAWQVGAIWALTEMGRKYDAIVGTSVGAVNGAGYSMLGVQGLRDLWGSIRGTKDVMSLNWQWPWNYSGVYDFDPLEKFLKKQMGGKTFSVPVYAATLNLQTAMMEYPLLGEVDPIQAILDSSSVAGIHRLRPTLKVDGGHKEVAPVRFAVEHLKATHVDVVLCDPAQDGRNDAWKPTGLPLKAVALRALGSMVDEIIRTDVADVEKCCLFQPNNELPFDSLKYDPDSLKRMIDLGFCSVRVQEYRL